MTTEEPVITLCHHGYPPAYLEGEDSAPIDELLKLNEGTLEEVYATKAGTSETVETIAWERRSPAVFDGEIARPRVVIPVFPGTNCEYDSVRACLRAGMDAETVVIRNLTADGLAQSALELERAIKSAQIVFLPGGFSGGDEPEGSAKLIVSFFRNPRLTDAVHDLLKHRDGLMLGISPGRSRRSSPWWPGCSLSWADSLSFSLPAPPGLRPQFDGVSRGGGRTVPYPSNSTGCSGAMVEMACL